MTVFDLTKDEKAELKCNYLAGREAKDLSMSEISMIDLLVTDSEIEDVYADCYFTADDFFCNKGIDVDEKEDY